MVTQSCASNQEPEQLIDSTLDQDYNSKIPASGLLQRDEGPRDGSPLDPPGLHHQSHVHKGQFSPRGKKVLHEIIEKKGLLQFGMKEEITCKDIFHIFYMKEGIMLIKISFFLGESI